LKHLAAEELSVVLTRKQILMGEKLLVAAVVVLILVPTQTHQVAAESSVLDPSQIPQAVAE